MKTLKTENGIKIEVRNIEDFTDNAKILEFSGYPCSFGDYVEGFQVDMELDATLANGTSESFTVSCQSADRSDRLRAHGLADMRFAQHYGADWDESRELEKFVDYEDWEKIAEFLIDLAEDMCQKWYNGENKMKFEELTPEQLDVSPEQLRSCVRVMPWEASKYYCEEDLAGKKLECCKEKTK